MCQKDVRPCVQKRWRTMSFSRVSTGDSVIPSSCEMKYEPAFKPLQGHPAFFWVRASWGSFHLSQKTQSPSHIPISEGRLLLRCFWKVGLPLQSKRESFSSRVDMGCTEHSSNCSTEIDDKPVNRGGWGWGIRVHFSIWELVDTVLLLHMVFLFDIVSLDNRLCRLWTLCQSSSILNHRWLLWQLITRPQHRPCPLVGLDQV